MTALTAQQEAQLSRGELCPITGNAPLPCLRPTTQTITSIGPPAGRKIRTCGHHNFDKCPVVLDPPEVGSFYVDSWGYDQTNVDFYRVRRVSDTGKTVWLEPWPVTFATDSYNGGPTEYVVPVEYSSVSGYNPPVTMHRLRPDSPWISINSYRVAKRWDGTPQYRTGAGWGH